MAAKTPDSIRIANLGDMKMLIATFSTTNIDDNDTWDTGMKSYIAHFTEQTTPEGPNDLMVDGVSAGVLTFSCEANTEGIVYVLGLDY